MVARSARALVARLRRLRTTTLPVTSWLARYRAEVLTALALVVGWTFLTAAVAELVGAGRVVWLASVGLFLLSLVGWRLLGTIVFHGLYALTRSERRG